MIGLLSLSILLQIVASCLLVAERMTSKYVCLIPSFYVLPFVGMRRDINTNFQCCGCETIDNDPDPDPDPACQLITEQDPDATCQVIRDLDTVFQFAPDPDPICF